MIDGSIPTYPLDNPDVVVVFSYEFIKLVYYNSKVIGYILTSLDEYIGGIYKVTE